MIHFELVLKDDVIGSYFLIKEKGNISNINQLSERTQVANLYTDQSGWVACDSNRVVTYTAANVTFTNILLAVRGWTLN
jgi:hypothetical protein